MLYGYISNQNIIIFDADHNDEFGDYVERARSMDGHTVIEDFDAILDERVDGDVAVETPISLPYMDDVKIVSREAARERIADKKQVELTMDEERTFAEQFNIRDDEDNQWDKRTLEERARDRLIQNLSAAPDSFVTPESFRMAPKKEELESGINLTDLLITMDNGEIIGGHADFILSDDEGNETVETGPRPWDEDFDHSRVYDMIADPNAFRDVRPSEIGFCVAETDEGSMIVFSPVKCIDAGVPFDMAIWPMIRLIIPSNLNELGNREFQSPESPDMSRSRLAQMGFVHSVDLIKLVDADQELIAERAAKLGRPAPTRYSFVDGPIDLTVELETTELEKEQVKESFNPVVISGANDEVYRMCELLVLNNPEEDDNGNLVFSSRVSAAQVVDSLRYRNVSFTATVDDLPYEPDEDVKMAIEKANIGLFSCVQFYDCRAEDFHEALKGTRIRFSGTILRLIETQHNIIAVCPFEIKATKLQSTLSGHFKSDDPVQMTASMKRFDEDKQEDTEEKPVNELTPWGKRAMELVLMTPGQLEVAYTDITPDMFEFCAREKDGRVEVVLVPKALIEKDELFDGDLPPRITAPMNPHFDRVGPSTYVVRRSSLHEVEQRFATIGIKENIFLRSA